MSPYQRFTAPTRRPERSLLFLAYSPFERIHTNKYTCIPAAERTEEDDERLMAVKFKENERKTLAAVKKLVAAVPYRLHELTISARMFLSVYLRPEKEPILPPPKKSKKAFERANEVVDRWTSVLRFSSDPMGPLENTLMDAYTYWAESPPRPQLEQVEPQVKTRSGKAEDDEEDEKAIQALY